MVLFCRRFPIVSEYIKSKRNDRKRNNKVGKTKPARGVKAKRIVNQAVTKKLRKNCKKIWWIGKVVVPLQSVKR